MQAAVFFGILFQGFSVRGWLAKESRTVHNEEYLGFIDDVSFPFVVEDGVGPEVGDTRSVLCGCPALVRKTRIMTMFRLICLCLDHGRLDLFEAMFGSSAGVCDGPDLSGIIEPVQSLFAFKKS